MTTVVNDTERRALVAATKAERARDGEKAMLEYQAETQALLANAARLRALRLAKEAAAAAAPPPAPKKRKPASKVAR